ncbi:MAG: cadmium resistance transporter [Methanobacterium sp.]|uniref:cadmium resistance transporter n=1 Tax=Methanobacterium sp. TaxID=2164 RepID=UPI003D65059B|nr:cadmium resistance transporter [Methanobacterium sp.]
MVDIVLIFTSIMAFVATNIDDLFILTLFFANPNIKNAHVVIGQYIGILSLIMISLMGYFFKFIIPISFLGLLGIIPILIGIKAIINLKKNEKIHVDEMSQNKGFKSSSIFLVALVSFSNGGDNIGVYMPLFASMDLYQTLEVVGIFILMIGIWCFISHSLTNNEILRDKIKKYGHIIFPFVLIIIGLFIILK